MLTIRKIQLLLLLIPFSAFSITENKKTTENDSVKFYYEIGLKFFDENKDSSLYYAEKAIRFGINKKASNTLAASYQLKGRCLFYKSKFDQSIKFHNKSLSINLKNNDKEALAANYFYLSQSYNLKNDFTKVLTNLNNARKYYELLNDSIGVARIYNNYAILYYKQNNKKLEKENLEKAIEILIKLKSEKAKRLLDVIYFNNAISLREEKKYDEALKIFLKQYDKHKIYNKTDLPLVSRALGMTYLGLKDYDLAEKYIQESLNLYLKRKNISGYADCYRELGEIYYLTNRKEKAIEVTELALKSSLEIGELESVKLCYEKLHLYHKEIHEYKKAYENLILFKKYSDSIFNEKINDDLTQQKINFELTKNDLVNKNKRKLYEQESKNKLKTQKTILIITIIAAFLFLIISFISFQQFKKSKNQNQIIINQKKKIEHSLNEKEVLLKEVYHRVKNNLQIISSLLEIQINQNDNKSFTKSAKEIQNKIQVISLLHQNLYESDNLNYINFEKYIEELIQYFSKIYLLQNDNIKFHFNCENINLRISQAIPLGLIINELVSNAFKHSFKTKNKGNIWISLKLIEKINVLTLENDGELIPDNFKLEEQNTLGLKLVRILSEQLNGTFSFQTVKNKNIFIIKFNS